MAINIKGIEFLSYEEQVIKNKKDIETLNKEINDRDNPLTPKGVLISKDTVETFISKGILEEVLGIPLTNCTLKLKVCMDDVADDSYVTITVAGGGNVSRISFETIYIRFDSVGLMRVGVGTEEDYLEGQRIRIGSPVYHNLYAYDLIQW